MRVETAKKRAGAPGKFNLLMPVVLLSCLLTSPSAAIASDGWNTITHLESAVGKWTPHKSNKAVLDEAAGLIDYEEMARRSLSHHWNGLSALDRRQFVRVFKGFVEERYYPRWHRIFSKGKIRLEKEEKSGNERLVHTRLDIGRKQDTVVWRTNDKKGDTRIVGLSVNNKDLIQRLGTRLDKYFAKEGFAKLLAWMKDKADLENGEEKEAYATL
ncbi:MAG: ABC transporter substrate-binding protein [Cyanobacteria bacterium]|nr:ABC transporter substrate-binding protein [Cyanobacteriota bacterium]